MYFKKLKNPYLFQGRNKKRQYFEGWYYKLVSADQTSEIAFIPGVSLGNDTHSFVQVFVSRRHNESLNKSYYSFSIDDFKYADEPFKITIHNNHFSLDHLDINLVNENLSVVGTIDIKDIDPFKPGFLTPNIMGFFGYFGFMECYHGLVSMTSNITGVLNVDGEAIDFNGAKLYIEKDWGKSFPRAYVWMQSNHFEDKDTSFMFSYADIPFLGLYFKGLIAVLKIKDEHYLFATYNGAKVKKEVIESNQVLYTIKHKHHLLEIIATQKETVALASPKKGHMIEEIKEGLSGEVQIKLYENNDLIYAGTGLHAGIEIMKKATPK